VLEGGLLSLAPKLNSSGVLLLIGGVPLQGTRHRRIDGNKEDKPTEPSSGKFIKAT
jgi:hypothetical protein